MKILIVGAGIAGLALSAHLRKNGNKVKIVEKAKEIKPKGFVLGLWGAGIKTLQEFNIHEDLKKVGHFPTRFNLRDKNGKVLRRFDFTKLIRKFGLAITLLRADFHKILLKINNDQKIDLNCSVLAIKDVVDGVVVKFTTGKEEKFDLVVGADGIHSIVRELVFGTGYVKYSGLTSWIYMVPGENHFRPNVSEIWDGERFFGIYPYRDEKLCAIFAVKTGQNTITTFPKEKFADFGWLAKDIISSMKENEEIFQTDWNEVDLKSWVKGRVVLIGDAAHAMLPTAGSGASMALEDAYWLSLELDANTNIDLALRNYIERRWKAVESLRTHTDFIGFLIKLSGPFSALRDILIKIVPEWLINSDLKYLMSIQEKEHFSDYYSFNSVWKVRFSEKLVREKLFDFNKWPKWWVEARKVRVLKSPKGVSVYLTFGFWVYQLEFEIDDVKKLGNSWVGQSIGDLYGTANIRMIEHNGLTEINIRWDVFAEKPIIKFLSRYFHPIFTLAHSYAMESGRKGLVRELNSDRI